MILSLFTYGYSQRHLTPVLSKPKTAPPQCLGATVYTQVKLPPSIPPMFWGETGNPVPNVVDPPKSSLKRRTLRGFAPLFKGGWGDQKLMGQLLKTSVYTVANTYGEG